MRLAVPLVVLALLAGCLEEASPAATPGDDAAAGAAPPAPPPGAAELPLPLPEPLPTPPLPSEEPREDNATEDPPREDKRLLYHRDHAFTEAHRGWQDAVAVPPDAPWLLFEVAIAQSEAPAAKVSLYAPDGSFAAGCDRPRCDAWFEAPAAGAWLVVYAGVSDQNASVNLVAVATPPDDLPPPPPDRVEDVPPTTPTPTTPTPTPPPEDEPALPLHHNLYRVLHESGGGRINRTDQVRVLAGYGALRGSLHVESADATAANAPRIVLLGPDGAERWDCARSCVVDLPAEAGLWRVQYAGEGAATMLANLTLVEGHAIERPDEVLLYAMDHSFWSHGARGAFHEAFAAPIGYEHLVLTVRFGQATEDRSATEAAVVVRHPAMPDPARCAATSAGDVTCKLGMRVNSTAAWDVHFEGASTFHHADVRVVAVRTDG